VVHGKGRKKGREKGGRKIITGGAKIVKMKTTQSENQENKGRIGGDTTS